ncbi:MAG: hypothetical protein E6J47_04800 [Chloroflexi bacterium]|nr:MAG: hypothetical protein E6J47_04800 [Chloroflexota bacterium]
MAEFIVPVLAGAIMVGLALWRPGIAIMALGLFLFVQSALVRLGGLPLPLRMTMARADEIVLAALVVRTTGQWLILRTPSLPKPLWAMLAFGVIGLLSAVVNRVGPLEAAVGIFLATKAGLWLYVGCNLKVDAQAVARYAYLVGALFIGVIAVATLQFLGVALPWKPEVRAGVIAANSIWNQHTAFGGALTVAVGLSVAAFRLPGERVSATILGVSSAGGILLSTARRLFVSLAVAAMAMFFALPSSARARIRSSLQIVRRPAFLVVVIAALGLATVAIGPRIANLAELTWQRYVVELTQRDRYRLYEGAFRLVERSPLLGRGPATYGSYASVVFDSPAYQEVGFRRRNPSMVVGGQLGSMIAEYGVLGVLAFASFVALLVRALLPISRGASGTIHAALATAGIFMVADLVVEAVVNPVFSNSFITFFTFVGIGVALTLDASSERMGHVELWHSDLISARWRVGTLVAAFLLLAALGTIASIAVHG